MGQFLCAHILFGTNHRVEWPVCAPCSLCVALSAALHSSTRTQAYCRPSCWNGMVKTLQRFQNKSLQRSQKKTSQRCPTMTSQREILTPQKEILTLQKEIL